MYLGILLFYFNILVGTKLLLEILTDDVLSVSFVVTNV